VAREYIWYGSGVTHQTSASCNWVAKECMQNFSEEPFGDISNLKTWKEMPG